MAAQRGCFDENNRKIIKVGRMGQIYLCYDIVSRIDHRVLLQGLLHSLQNAWAYKSLGVAYWWQDGTGLGKALLQLHTLAALSG